MKQLDAFISTKAGKVDEVAEVAGSGVVIKFKIPKSIGAGAYINPISKISGKTENEFLLNNNGVYKFHAETLKKLPDGNIYVEADWLGAAKRQSFDTGKKKKK